MSEILSGCAVRAEIQADRAAIEERFRELDPVHCLDVMIALTVRLSLAIDKLTELAAACPDCGGTGETGELYELRIMTDDPRLLDRPQAHKSRDRVRRDGPQAVKRACGAAVLKSPCLACADLLDTIKTCEASR